MTPYPLQAGGSAVLVPPRRQRRTPGLPPGRGGGGGGGGGGDGDGGGGHPRGGGAGDVGPFALVLLMAGISTLFLVLIAVWLFLRRPAPDWRAENGPALEALWLSTLCLLASSVAVERAARLARAGARRPVVRAWLGASIALGVGFLGAQALLWTAVWSAGLVPASSGYAAVFFALTGLHALHVLGGLGFLGALARALGRAALPPVRAASVRLGATYWHFMGALWLVLFTLLYFVR